MTANDPAPPRFLPCGDTALTIEFGRDIDPEVSRTVLALDEALRHAAIPGLVETVPTYRSLTVQVDPLAFDPHAFETRVRAMLATLSVAGGAPRRWHVPVVYGGEYGWDLEDVAQKHGLTVNEVIRRHSEAVYRVYMIGFLPGLCYLGGLDQSIALPRRTNPRPRVPAGNISIGGVQALMGSVESPSGWHILGQTPMRNYMPRRDPVFLIDAGDEVVFIPTDASRWNALDKAAEAGEWVGEVVTP